MSPQLSTFYPLNFPLSWDRAVIYEASGINNFIFFLISGCKLPACFWFVSRWPGRPRRNSQSWLTPRVYPGSRIGISLDRSSRASWVLKCSYKAGRPMWYKASSKHLMCDWKGKQHSNRVIFFKAVYNSLRLKESGGEGEEKETGEKFGPSNCCSKYFTTREVAETSENKANSFSRPRKPSGLTGRGPHLSRKQPLGLLSWSLALKRGSKLELQKENYEYLT